MAFVLPSKYTAATAPAPKDGSAVTLKQTEAQTLAVVDFSGFATEGEIARRKASLLDALAADGVQLDLAGGYTVFQYNPPYTLPWQGRDELAVAVVAAQEQAEPAAAGAEAD